MRFASGAAFSLESKDSKGGRWSVLLCSLPLLLFMPLSWPFLLLWRSPLYPYLPLAILLRFPHPFFNSPCAFSQGLPRNQRNKRRRLRFKRPILVSPFSPPFFLFFFFPFSFLFFWTKSVSPLFFLFFWQELMQVLEILNWWFLRELWDPSRLLAFKLSRGLKVPWHLRGVIHQGGRL